MAMELTPTTELEAVNEMLGTIGESPISDLETVGNLDASTARDTLRAVCREVQSKGWWFNEFSGHTFTLNSDGKAVVPAAILSVRPVIGGARYFARGGFLVTAPQGVDVYDEAPVADVIFMYDFELLPESARRYIAIRAARIFQTKVLGSDQLNVFSKEHEAEAYGVIADEQYDFTRAERINFMSGSQDVSQIWNPTG